MRDGELAMNSCPLVMCLTNCVAADLTANGLLAIGAKPAMVEDPSEAAELAPHADAVLVNLGTVHQRQEAAMRAALAAIARSSDDRVPVPWVLDPVACQLLSYRGRLAAEFVRLRPTLIRGNHAEIDHLLRTVPEAASVPILSTGEVDRIYAPTPDSQPLLITGGVAMLQTVTATGCTQGAICAAMLGKGRDPLAAAEAASRLLKCAGERAWARARSPGSFRSALVDSLYDLSSR